MNNRADSGAGVSTSYSYDGLSRLSSFTHDASGTSDDLTISFGYNPASQIVSRTVSNAAYKWAVAADLTVNYTDNTLNQIATLAGSTVDHDARGNAEDDTAETYDFDYDNRLTDAGAATQSYDPLGRLYEVDDASTTKFLYAGASVIAEYDGSNALQRRFIHGPGVDEPVVWLEGSGTTSRTWLTADERGSIVAHATSAAAVTAKNTYDAFGVPAAGNTGRFQYTGQMWIAEAGLYHYRARAYSPATGRFMQPDPIGYAGGMNLYAYVGNDPVNFIDPMGLTGCRPEDRDCIIVPGTPNSNSSSYWATPEYAWRSYLESLASSIFGRRAGATGGGSNGEEVSYIDLVIMNIEEFLRCPVAQVAFVIGGQGSGTLTAGLRGNTGISFSGSFDAGSANLTLALPNTRGSSATFTQGANFSGSLDVAGKPIFTTTKGKSGSAPFGFENGYLYSDLPIVLEDVQTSDFLGFELGGVLGVGLVGTVGYDQPGHGNPCPSNN